MFKGLRSYLPRAGPFKCQIFSGMNTHQTAEPCDVLLFRRSRKNTLNCTLPILLLYMLSRLFRDLWPPRWLSVNFPDNAGHAKCADLISGLVRSLGEGNGNPLQYSWLDTP